MSFVKYSMNSFWDKERDGFYTHFELIDSEFNDYRLIEGMTLEYYKPLCEIYEKRNLNVAANLALAIKYTSVIRTESVENLWRCIRIFNYSKYQRYSLEIEKYLSLL